MIKEKLLVILLIEIKYILCKNNIFISDAIIIRPVSNSDSYIDPYTLKIKEEEKAVGFDRIVINGEGSQGYSRITVLYNKDGQLGLNNQRNNLAMQSEFTDKLAETIFSFIPVSKDAFAIAINQYCLVLKGNDIAFDKCPENWNNQEENNFFLWILEPTIRLADLEKCKNVLCRAGTGHEDLKMECEQERKTKEDRKKNPNQQKKAYEPDDKTQSSGVEKDEKLDENGEDNIDKHNTDPETDESGSEKTKPSNDKRSDKRSIDNKDPGTDKSGFEKTEPSNEKKTNKKAIDNEDPVNKNSTASDKQPEEDSDNSTHKETDSYQNNSSDDRRKPKKRLARNRDFDSEFRESNNRQQDDTNDLQRKRSGKYQDQKNKKKLEQNDEKEDYDKSQSQKNRSRTRKHFKSERMPSDSGYESFSDADTSENSDSNDNTNNPEDMNKKKILKIVLKAAKKYEDDIQT